MGDQLTGLVRNIHVELTAGSGGVVVHSSTVVLGERSAAYVQNAIREWPFGETPRAYYCRDQVSRKEQGCALSLAVPSTEHHGSHIAVLMTRSVEHTSELQSRFEILCRLVLG